VETAIGKEKVRRGWTTPYKYLSEKRQRAALAASGVEERVIYSGKSDWPTFVRSLRHGDEAVVAELRIFGSRRALGLATAEVEARQAVLVVADGGIRIHPPTVRAVHLSESQWAGERSMGGSKRARMMSAKGNETKRKLTEAARMPEAKAEAIWRDLEGYPLRRDALAAMPGWTVMTAWRKFGPRELK
jgi:hypothetical protein